MFHNSRKLKYLAYISLVFLLIFSGSSCVSAPKLTVNQKAIRKISRISVVEFSDAPGAEAGRSGFTVSGSIVNELLKLKKITVLERNKKNLVVAEHELNLSGLIDEKTAVKIGKLLGVDSIIVGAVSQYKTSTIPIFLGLFTYYQDVYNVSANLRIIDVETGEIILGGESSAKSSESYQDAASKIANSVISQLATLLTY